MADRPSPSQPPMRFRPRVSLGTMAAIAAALLIPLLVLAFFLVQWLVPHEGDDRLVGVKLAQPGAAASPPSLLTADDMKALNNITNDGSLFGMPMAVRVVRVSEPMTEEETQAAAARYVAATPIETTPGAKDGLLFYIAVPMNQPKAATAAFVPGEHFFPQMGLTQERLDTTLNDIVTPRLALGNYADAAKQGAAWVVYDQLFGTMPRIPLTHGQQVLNHLANWVLAPLVAVLTAGYAGLALWSRRAARQNRGLAAAPIDSPYIAAAVARGRADDALPAGAMLALIDAGNLQLAADGRTIAPGPEPDGADPFACAIWERTRELSEPAGGAIPRGAVLRLDDAFAPQLAYLESRLISGGLFSSQIPAMNRLMWGSGFLLVLIIASVLVPSLIGRAAAGFIVGCLALAVIAGLTWWTLHRYRSTDAGIREARIWLTTQQQAALAGDTAATLALRTYRDIVRQEDMVAERTALRADRGTHALQIMARLRGMSVA